MNLLSSFSQAIEERLVRFWPAEARRALARVLHEVYHADGKFSEEEQTEFDAFSSRLGTSASEIASLELGAALAVLEKDAKKRKVTYVWIAHALFADGSWNAEEKAFVARIIEKYKLAGAELRAEIKAVQSRKVEEGMKAILEDIGA